MNTKIEEAIQILNHDPKYIDWVYPKNREMYFFMLRILSRLGDREFLAGLLDSE